MRRWLLVLLIGCAPDERSGREPSAPDPVDPRTATGPREPEDRVVQLVSNDADFCVLRANGDVECIGRNAIAIPANPMQSIAIGIDHACALDLADELVCWPLEDASFIPPFGAHLDVAVARHFACAIRADERISCWQTGGFAYAPIPHEGPHITLAAGERHACALDLDRRAHCWGTDPLTPPPPLSFVELSALGDDTCGVTASGVAKCWGGEIESPAGLYRSYHPGNGGCGARFDGTIECQSTDGVPTTDGWTRVVASADNACALDPSGHVECWGLHFQGQIEPPAGPHSALSVGRYHACALDDGGTPVCWGHDTLGDTAPPPGLTGLVDLQTDTERTCGQNPDGTLVCWGGASGDPVPPQALGAYDVSSHGGVGIDAATGEAVGWGDLTANVAGLTGPFRDVSIQGAQGCLLDLQDQLHCWNLDAPPLGPTASVAVSITFACALDPQGGLTCWDDPPNGSPPPTEPLVDVALNYTAACGLEADGTAHCWGTNSFSQLRVPSEHRYTTVQPGEGFGCGLTTDDAIVCWGTDRTPFSE